MRMLNLAAPSIALVSGCAAAMRNMVILICIIFISGCASNRLNLVERGDVAVEVIAGDEASLPKVEVYQYDGEILVKGEVESRPRGGHVHIRLISPDGRVLSDETAYYRPHKHPWSGLKTFPRYTERHAKFEKRIFMVPPKGSKVRLTVIKKPRCFQEG